MRPVRFVALSEDGNAFVLADEVGRLLALPNDERMQSAMRVPGHPGSPQATATMTDQVITLSPRDIQARIRAGESADDVARVAGVPVDRVLRYAGPVLQERAMLAQHARRTRLKTSDKGASLAEVVDGRLAQHGVDGDKIAWDAYRREDGTWRIVATWPSGKATAQAIWELDKTRTQVTPHDDMAQYLCADRPTPILGQDPQIERAGRGLAPPLRGEGGGRGGHEPMRPSADTARRESRPGRGLGEPSRSGDPIRAGRDALLASLDRPLSPAEPSGLSPDVPRGRSVSGGAAALLGGASGSAFDEDPDLAKEVPAVPSLAVLRPRRASSAGGDQAQSGSGDQPRKRLPSWDDVLFGSAPARESS
ncbi:septation protein SepH [Rugosimonospora acidiphila]|uniref:Septation protein SepH n=1 Tax=Rugosimonospora acidiphila TaxID=556531 RepID=A0ABP9SNG4_9ACTN